MKKDPLLPNAPAKIFFVGIGGIGMSALAQLLHHCGYTVTGSDRSLQDKAKQQLYDKLRNFGISLFPQDGSGVIEFQPDILVYSAAVEDDNPDFAAMTKIPRLHRAAALSQALNKLPAKQIAVAGSCGKTTVCGWLSSALRKLGKRILMVNGGYSVEFEDENLPGNFFADENPEFIIVEVDESDKSIKEFSPDYSILLNIANDHYEKEVLQEVFANFLNNTKKAAVLPYDLRQLAGNDLSLSFFSETAVSAVAPAKVLFPENYHLSPAGCRFSLKAFPSPILLSQSGLYSAWNACAVLQMLLLLHQQALLTNSPNELSASLFAFQGIQQRFEIFATAASVIPKINDYAHNPEKLSAVIAAARERFGSPLQIFFQPHGYAPLAFMRSTLKENLKEVLQENDEFIFLPVYYAGGSSSHSPSSSEVAQEYQAAGLPVSWVVERKEAEKLIKANKQKSCLLVLGARDASLREWTKELEL